MNDQRDDMKLPEGKTCRDCKWLDRCRMLFQQRADSRQCDWSPHRFQQKAGEKEPVP